jgi:nucleotide-binding universal stress UspA family protein
MDAQTHTFGTILVPLDGSALAEQAMPLAGRLASATESSMLLVRVVGPISPPLTFPNGTAPAEIYQAVFDAEKQAVQDYLAQQQQVMRKYEIPVQTLISYGVAELSLLDLMERPDIGLVVMTTHGRTGLARFALGSVADRLARGGTKPVLLLRAFDHAGPTELVDRALVPLDGSTRAEQALPLVQKLAGRVLREVRLVRVIAPDATAEEEEVAQQYLIHARERLLQHLGENACGVTIDVLRDPVSEQLLQVAESGGEMVIMTTHGRTGPTRWVLGSVADRVVYGAHVPVLLVRAS